MDKFLTHSDSDRDNDNEDRMDLGSDEEFFGGAAASDSEDEMIDKVQKSKKKVFDAFKGSDDDDDDESDHDKPQGLKLKGTESSKDKEEIDNLSELYRKAKIQKVKNKKPKGKTGVVYISKIPPYMKPTKLRQILSRFGDVDRLFLKRESTQKYQQRVKQGGNKKIMYEEGWAEFIRKKDAKLAAETLNCNIIGGKKSSFYYDDILNVKYLSGFKWADLTEQISKENEARQSKLQMEISQAHKLNKTFIRNVERSKMIENIKRKKHGKDGHNDDHVQDDETLRRTFEQRKVTTTRANAPEEFKKKEEKTSRILSNVF
ncbi:unnamed protein product [Cyberlindnera jadinii]|uniref:Pre-rRNA-processing protein ESF2 n=1 Tax=Cyberlindnera jadinii (strain ATCC 18201 / CBS 1600 / BCRC 20928 / JCM 3617 / NBRC 0987 / NRRL Y-1542) TaxID=983966 RepID=A0A0H5CAX4_CYBJN|nr:unnamed protein product [Cyberlindnera jadinii]